ncbi:MAG: hypothetical protein WEB00_12545 [Dehalococcoidia bacterium]
MSPITLPKRRLTAVTLALATALATLTTLFPAPGLPVERVGASMQFDATPACDPALNGTAEQDFNCVIVNDPAGTFGTGDAECGDGSCTLNAAIYESRLPDPAQQITKIHFNIDPGDHPDECSVETRICRIDLEGTLPALGGPEEQIGTELDATTQGCLGSSPYCIVIDGSTLPGSGQQQARGITVVTGHNIVRGFLIQNIFTGLPNSQAGIVLYQSTEDGNTTGERVAGNLVEDNKIVNVRKGIIIGVELTGGTQTDMTIQNNIIEGADRGISLDAKIIGTSTVTGNRVLNNTVSLRTNTTDENAVGIWLVATYAGHTTANIIQGNRISGGKGNGITLQAAGSCETATPQCPQAQREVEVSGNQLIKNTIENMTGDGILLVARNKRSVVSDNILQSNVILNSQLNGIWLKRYTGTDPNAIEGNRLIRNFTRGNRFLGINLGEAPDEVGGSKNGSEGVGCKNGSSGTGLDVNNNIPCPEITKTSASAGQCQVEGTGPPSATIEVFLAVAGAGDDNDSPAFNVKYGEATKWLATVRSDAAGKWTILIPRQRSGSILTSTAMKPADGTSEASANKTLAGGCLL